MTAAEFIAARLAEDEQAATQSGIKGARWDFTGSNCEVRIREPGGDLGAIVARCREGRAVDFSNTIHIARHDPGRVLRQVTAIRAILAAHRPYDTTDPPPPQRCYVCASGHAYRSGAAIQEEWPCPTLQNLAAIWADHPDYQQERKP